ncbi:MAG TPA: tripartite tricarboxylate transporter substrate binding protein [Burkholderiales bacterium]|nr:tripartite tricarboxylate transporter substrate binding protein [Burkholderiales bacterium]
MRFLVPNPPGGGTDLVARVVTQKVSESWGVNLVVDNRPGAGGIIAVEVAAKSAPDGYTLLMAHFPLAITVNLVKVAFDPVRDFAPVTLLATTQNVLLVNPSVPAKSVKEFIALAKAKPGELRYASGGSGTSMHVSAELFALMAGVSLTHVPYKGAAPALLDLISGQVQASFVSVPAAAPQIRSGKVRALAVTGPRRSQLLGDLPTLSEAGLSGYGSEQWYGVLAPRATPRAVIERLNKDFSWALSQPDTRKRLLDSGYEIAADTTADGFGRFLKSELAKWAGVIKKAGIKAQ